MRFSLLLAACCAICASRSSGAATLTAVSFEPNRGQGAFGAGYVAHGKGYLLSMWPARTELATAGARVSTILEGARSSAPSRAEAPLPGVVNYLRTNQPSAWLTGIPTFGRVRYQSVYRGVDVVYYGNDGRLEYDFVVFPGADAGQIRLRYQGVRGVRVDASGDLLLDTGRGSMRQHRPVIYQDVDGVRREIAGGYTLRGNTVRFHLGRYDRTRPLVIDPVLTWAAFTGYSGGDIAEAQAVDGLGNVYIAGSTLTPYGDTDVLVAKLSPDGATMLVQGVIGGSGDDSGHAIAVDTSGNLYLAGETASSNFPADGVYISQYAVAGVPHVFVVKLNPALTNEIYGHYIAGENYEVAYGLALDPSNNAFVVGNTASQIFPVSNGAAQRTPGGGWDAFVIKFNPTGIGLASTFLGGSGDEYAYSVAVDSSGNAYITGDTNSTNFPVSAGAFQKANAGGIDGFVAKLSPSLGAVYASYLGGSLDEVAFSLAVDSAGAAYVTGRTGSTDFPTASPMQAAKAGGYDTFISKVAPDGSSLVYSTYLGGAGDEEAYGITLDPGGNAYVTGYTSSQDFPLLDAFQTSNKGPWVAMVSGLNASGSALLFSSFLGGSGNTSPEGDTGLSISFGCSTGLTLTGATGSADFPVTAGGAGAVYGGGTSDGFVAKIAAGGSPVINPSNGVVNAATAASGPVAPGSIVSILGAGLAAGVGTPPVGNLPASLAGASVSIYGCRAPVAYASAGRLDVQVPYEAGAGSAAATVSAPCGTTQPYNFQVAAVAPYIYQNAAGDAVVLNQDGTANSSANPAAAGSQITVSMTGIGPVDNPVATGAAAPANPAAQATSTSKATIGGHPANIVFVGLTPQAVGKAQSVLGVPALAAGAYPVVVTVGGIDSNPAKVYVK